MFSVGEKVVYGSTGVCTIVDICVPDIPGVDRECYVLRPDYVEGSTVYAPVDGNTVKIRGLISREEAQELIDKMPHIDGFNTEQDRQELYKTYRSVLKSADSRQLARLVKTLYEKRRQVAQLRKPMPGREKEIFNAAEHILHGEMAAVLGISPSSVEGYITFRIGAGQSAAS